MKVKSLSAIGNTPIATNRKKIEHTAIQEDARAKVLPLESISSFCETLRTTARKYEKNLDVISRTDREIQDILHEIELLPAVNVVNGYHYYDRIREVRQARRIAKSENVLLKPLYDYLAQHPDFVKDMQSLNDACMSADVRVANFVYEYRIQE